MKQRLIPRLVLLSVLILAACDRSPAADFTGPSEDAIVIKEFPASSEAQAGVEKPDIGQETAEGSIPQPAPATDTDSGDKSPTAVGTEAESASPVQEPEEPISPGGAIAPTSPLPAEVAALLTDLDGLSFDAFLEESYWLMLRRDPEVVTQAGLTDHLGLDNSQLTDISDARLRQNQAIEAAILAALRAYDRQALTPEQQLSYDIYEWYLEDQVQAQPFMYHDYPVTFFITGVHNELIQFFTDIHPLTDRHDAEDYLSRLAQVDEKISQLLDGLERRQANGIVPPRFALQWAAGGIDAIARANARNTPFYQALVEGLPGISELETAERDALLAAAEEEIASSVIPAFQALAEAVDELEAVAGDDDGLWRLPEGDAYYRYLLRHHTTTEMSPAEIHALGLAEVDRIQAELADRFADLDYPADESLPQLMDRAAADGGTLYGDDILAGYEAIIEQAAGEVPMAFDLMPQADVVVIGVPQGGYYIRPAVDGSRPGAFYATASGSEDWLTMPTLAYHEAIPGHHMQLAIMQELAGLPAFRNGVSFTGYVEGWALYAEQLAYELGFYDDDPVGDIGRLQFELFRAARLVVDTGIHDLGWSFDEAVEYMIANTGLPRGMVEGQIARYIVYPGQATSYKIGMIKILALRDRAEAALGDDFDLKEFHNVVLGSGSVPLDILERIVDEYIQSKLSQSLSPPDKGT